MPLSDTDLKALQRPFKADEHEYRAQNGTELAYISEEAVTARLDEVDPNWSFEIAETQRFEKQVMVRARLTIKGVTRENIGMQDIGGVGEAEKGSATDALKRCARLFGVGRYLLTTKTRAGTEKYLRENGGAATRAQASQADLDAGKQALKDVGTRRVETGANRPTAAQPNAAAPPFVPNRDWLDAAFAQTNKHFVVRAHFDNFVKQQVNARTITATTTVEQFVKLAEANREASGKAGRGWYNDNAEVEKVKDYLKRIDAPNLEETTRIVGPMSRFDSAEAFKLAVAASWAAEDERITAIEQI